MFFKFDFSKAYDMEEWDFIFKVMVDMGFLPEFMSMVHLLFQDASATVKVNGIPSYVQDRVGREVELLLHPVFIYNCSKSYECYDCSGISRRKSMQNHLLW